MKLRLNFGNIVFFTVLIFSILGLAASFILTIEAFAIAKDANANLACDINSVFNCGSVMKTGKAESFGFPNPILGVIGYTAMVTLAIVHLVEKKLSMKLVYMMLFGAGLAFIFSYWLIYSSVFEIGILCIFCIISCISATNIFFALLVYCIKNTNFTNPIGLKLQQSINAGWFIPLITLWYVLIVTISYLQMTIWR